MTWEKKREDEGERGRKKDGWCGEEVRKRRKVDDR